MHSGADMKRPLSVTILACVYIAVGTIGFTYHLAEFPSRVAFRYADVWIEIVRLLAIVGGVFMLRGHNWARWLVVAWIAFHVAVSALHTFGEFAMHSLFCAVITWLLLRPDAARYFQNSKIERA